MKITPLDIRQKSFNKKLFNGYDPEEVTAFLNSLSQAWERVMDDNRELRMRLEIAERDANQFREVQTSLYKAIQAADDKHQELVEKGTQQANFLIREARATADASLKEAEWKSKAMVEEAEQQARNTYIELRNEVTNLRSEYNQLLGMRQSLLTEIKNFSNELLERLDREAINHKVARFDLPQMPSHLLPAPADKNEDDQADTRPEIAAAKPQANRTFVRTSPNQGKNTGRGTLNTPPNGQLDDDDTLNASASRPTSQVRPSILPSSQAKAEPTLPSAQPIKAETPHPQPITAPRPIAQPIVQQAPQAAQHPASGLNKALVDRPQNLTVQQPTAPALAETYTKSSGSFFDNIS